MRLDLKLFQCNLLQPLILSFHAVGKAVSESLTSHTKTHFLQTLLHKYTDLVVRRFDEIDANCSVLCVEYSALFPADKQK